MKSIIGSLLLVTAAALVSGGGVPSFNSPMVAADPLAASGRMSSLIWQKNGCHRVGHTRRISIPDCVEFHMTTNACRGYCESWSIPSSLESLAKNPAQLVTSIGQCCNIMETEDVTARIMCVDGPKELTFKSAKSCACFHCKKN